MALSPTDKKHLRAQIARFCSVAEQYSTLWHYTQNRPFRGFGVPPSVLHYNDCSGYVSLAFYWAARQIARKVEDPLGFHYSGWGNTDSCYSYIKAHHAPKDNYRVGDIALYLQREYQHHHVTICRKEGDGKSAVFSSNGWEGDPSGTNLHYRYDLTGVFRHPALL